MQLKSTAVALVASLAACLAASLAACGSKHDGNGTKDAGSGDALPPPVDAFTGPYSDFPGTIIDTGTPAGAAALFGAPGTGSATGGPCLVEPEVGTLYPQNWLRPRFTWVATGTENLFELTLTAANETTPLVVYTTATTWTMPAAIWTALASHIVDAPIMMTVRGLTYDTTSGALTSGPEIGSTGPISIAPAQADGAIVYWTTSDNTALKGFHIGDESVSTIIVPSNNGTTTQCVGCHSSTPDGKFVGFSASTMAGNGDPAMLGLLSDDGMFTTPPFLTASATALMARTFQEEPVFSPMHWKDGDHTAVTMFAVSGTEQIIWTDLEATSQTQGTGWDVVSRGSETTTASSASFAHNSDTLVYTAAASETSGTRVDGNGDIETVPFADRAGGTPTPVPGASTTEYNESYPTFSPDDKYLAFNRVAAGQTSYDDPAAEVYVIPAAGGTPVRLVANDPPTCSGFASPGITNSWPKWAPDTTDVNGKRYYWLTFSSKRTSTGNPQIYVTPVVDDGMTLTTYPALYLWNQPAAEANHTPAWDNFQIPLQ